MVNCMDLIKKLYGGRTINGKESSGESQYQEGICLVVQSQPFVPNVGEAIGAGSYGVTALYIFILVTVGSAVRGALLGNIGDLVYSEMPDPQVGRSALGTMFAYSHHYSLPCYA